MPDGKLKQAVEAYFIDLRLVRGSGGATDERSLYVPLANLLNAVGGTLRPKVFCVQDLANQGLVTPTSACTPPSRCRRASRSQARSPERGVIEVKPVADDAWLTSASDQVTGYWKEYRQVLATNYRDFVLVGRMPPAIRCASNLSAWPGLLRSSKRNWHDRGPSPTKSEPAWANT